MAVLDLKLTVGMNRFLSQNVSLSTRMFHSTKNIVENEILLALFVALSAAAAKSL